MKQEIKIRMENGKDRIIKGNKRTITFLSGETINVITDKRADKMWYVTHCASGLNIVPPRYYVYPRIVFFGDCDLDPTTEKNAIEIVRFTFDGYYKLYGKRFCDIWQEREKQLKERQ